MVIGLVDPRGRPADTSGVRLAPRPVALTRIGFLVNESAQVAGPSFGRYATVLDGWLRDRFGITVPAVTGFKPVLSRRADADLLDRYSECSAVVNGLAK